VQTFVTSFFRPPELHKNYRAFGGRTSSTPASCSIRRITAEKSSSLSNVASAELIAAAASVVGIERPACRRRSQNEAEILMHETNRKLRRVVVLFGGSQLSDMGRSDDSSLGQCVEEKVARAGPEPTLTRPLRQLLDAHPQKCIHHQFHGHTGAAPAHVKPLLCIAAKIASADSNISRSPPPNRVSVPASAEGVLPEIATSSEETSNCCAARCNGGRSRRDRAQLDNPGTGPGAAQHIACSQVDSFPRQSHPEGLDKITSPASQFSRISRNFGT